MLGDGHQLDMRVVVLQEVGDELLTQHVVIRTDLPGTDVDLIDIDRHVDIAGACVDPFVVVPLVGGAGDDGVCRRRGNGGLGERVGLVDAAGVLGLDGKLVALAHADARDEDFPDARGA